MSKKPKHRKKKERRWWVVAAVYASIHPNTKSRSLSKRLGERRVFLVYAKNEEKAKTLGAEIARDQEHRYKATGGDLVACKLKKIEVVLQLFDKELRHGTEVYWDRLVDEKRRRRPLIV